MIRAVCEDQNQSVRLLKKTVFLLYDLVINDDLIFKEDPCFVRKGLLADEKVIVKMLEYLLDEDLDDHQKLDVREYILRIFKYLVNYQHNLLDYIKNALDTLKVRLA